MYVLEYQLNRIGKKYLENLQFEKLTVLYVTNNFLMIIYHLIK